MFLVCIQNHTGGPYCMLNIYIKCVVLSRGSIYLNKTYGKYVSRKEHTKSDIYVLQDNYKYDKWAHMKIGPDETKNFKTK